MTFFYMDQTNYFIVLTGGPGVGKTTLINKIQKQGYRTVPEDARRIIKEQLDSNGDGLPWKNRQYYATLMLAASTNSFLHEIKKSATDPGYVFFDRGIPDTLAYIEMENLIIEESLLAEAKAHRYYKKIFILPPWQEIYETDNERKQTWEEAEATFNQMKNVYEQLGYEVVEIPKTTVEQRYQFILDALRSTDH
ncbi:hypothetical protein D3C87_455160 [compost metagenome]